MIHVYMVTVGTGTIQLLTLLKRDLREEVGSEFESRLEVVKERSLCDVTLLQLVLWCDLERYMRFPEGFLHSPTICVSLHNHEGVPNDTVSIFGRYILYTCTCSGIAQIPT